MPQIIKIGSVGDDVRLAQQRLFDRGYLYPESEIDGIYGPRTFAAVVRYQEDRSTGRYWAFSFPLKIDGIVGPATWSRLDPPTVRNGSSGNTVRLLQEILKMGFAYPPFDPGPIDSAFGPLTETAVRNFQTDYGLTVDGVVGPITWAYLWS